MMLKRGGGTGEKVSDIKIVRCGFDVAVVSHSFVKLRRTRHRYGNGSNHRINSRAKGRK